VSFPGFKNTVSGTTGAGITAQQMYNSSGVRGKESYDSIILSGLPPLTIGVNFWIENKKYKTKK